MLTYTFSRREKTLILILIIVLLAVVWYMLVYRGTSDELMRIESESAAVNEQITIAAAKASQMDYMEKVIEQRKAQGVKPTPIPMYDNMQKLMTRLDSVMSSATSYQLSFDELDVQSSKYIMRPVTVTFQCESYAQAEKIVEELAAGPYPCLITSVSIVDGTVRGSNRGSGACSGQVDVVFFEKNDGSFAVAPTEEEQAAAAAEAA